MKAVTLLVVLALAVTILIPSKAEAAALSNAEATAAAEAWADAVGEAWGEAMGEPGKLKENFKIIGRKVGIKIAQWAQKKLEKQ